MRAPLFVVLAVGSALLASFFDLIRHYLQRYASHADTASIRRLSTKDNVSLTIRDQSGKIIVSVNGDIPADRAELLSDFIRKSTDESKPGKAEKSGPELRRRRGRQSPRDPL
jgi:hypothetical protein